MSTTPLRDARYITPAVGTDVRLKDGTPVTPANAYLHEATAGTIEAWTNAGFRGMEARIVTIYGRVYGVSAADLEVVR